MFASTCRAGWLSSMPRTCRSAESTLNARTTQPSMTRQHGEGTSSGQQLIHVPFLATLTFPLQLAGLRRRKTTSGGRVIRSRSNHGEPYLRSQSSRRPILLLQVCPDPLLLPGSNLETSIGARLLVREQHHNSARTVREPTSTLSHRPLRQHLRRFVHIQRCALIIHQTALPPYACLLKWSSTGND